jgi:hypothetical protein
LLFDLNRIRQEQYFLTLRVIPIHLWWVVMKWTRPCADRLR